MDAYKLEYVAVNPNCIMTGYKTLYRKDGKFFCTFYDESFSFEDLQRLRQECPGFYVCTYDHFSELEDLHTEETCRPGQVDEITAERYEHFLNVLPPAKMYGSFFAVPEAITAYQDDQLFTHCGEVGDRYFTAVLKGRMKPWEVAQHFKEKVSNGEFTPLAVTGTCKSPELK